MSMGASLVGAQPINCERTWEHYQNLALAKLTEVSGQISALCAGKRPGLASYGIQQTEAGKVLLIDAEQPSAIKLLANGNNTLLLQPQALKESGLIIKVVGSVIRDNAQQLKKVIVRWGHVLGQEQGGPPTDVNQTVNHLRTLCPKLMPFMHQHTMQAQSLGLNMHFTFVPDLTQGGRIHILESKDGAESLESQIGALRNSASILATINYTRKLFQDLDQGKHPTYTSKHCTEISLFVLVGNDNTGVVVAGDLGQAEVKSRN